MDIDVDIDLDMDVHTDEEIYNHSEVNRVWISRGVYEGLFEDHTS